MNFTLPRLLAGGRNNRVYHSLENGSVTKQYLQDDDPRLRREWAFLRFCWEQGIRSVPEPQLIDEENQSATYRYIEGQKIRADQLNSDHIQQAALFIKELNTFKDSPTAKLLPMAREAAFSIAQHQSMVEKRVLQLTSSCARPKEWVEDRLIPQWKKAVKYLVSHDIPPTLSEQALSPSDFGFHNALLQADGTVVFLDFEYAGWDDPAKLLCDFFCQVEVPIPQNYWKLFIDSALQVFSETVVERAEALLPLYRIKWCCILLNTLIRPENRLYAGVKEPLKQQLEKCDKLLSL